MSINMKDTHSNEFIISILKQNDELKNEVARLKEKLKNKKQDLKKPVRDARKARMAATWEPGGANYHRSPAYKDLSDAELKAYHAEHPVDWAAKTPRCGKRWREMVSKKK